MGREHQGRAEFHQLRRKHIHLIVAWCLLGELWGTGRLPGILISAGLASDCRDQDALMHRLCLPGTH